MSFVGRSGRQSCNFNLPRPRSFVLGWQGRSFFCCSEQSWLQYRDCCLVLQLIFRAVLQSYSCPLVKTFSILFLANKGREHLSIFLLGTSSGPISSDRSPGDSDSSCVPQWVTSLQNHNLLSNRMCNIQPCKSDKSKMQYFLTHQSSQRKSLYCLREDIPSFCP